MLTSPNAQPKTPGSKVKQLGTITDRQQAIYKAIVEFKMANDGNSPSFRELMAATNVPSSSVLSFNLKRLQTEGLIQLDHGSRMIRVNGGRWSLNS